MNWRSFSRLAVEAGNGRVVGSGGSVSHRSRSQSDVRLLSLSVLLSLIAETVSGDRSISLTHGGECGGYHAQLDAGLSAEEELVRAVGDVRELSCLQYVPIVVLA